jgi:hypothetical protein
MKNLEKFELDIPKNHIIVTFFPTPDEVTSLIITAKDTKQNNQEKPSVPCVVAGINVDQEENDLKLSVGDLVYVKPEFISSCFKLIVDAERSWKNPIIAPSFTIIAKVTGAKCAEFIASFEEGVEKTEASITAKETRLAQFNNDLASGKINAAGMPVPSKK